MKRELKMLAAVHKKVTGLVQRCGKDGRLYEVRPKAVAQVSRTAKWLLNAITQLQSEIGL
jgi:hypothetical protein